NQLIGRKGHVQFVPTGTTEVMFAGQGHPPRKHHHTTPPTGTFFAINKNGKIAPIPTPHQPSHGKVAQALAQQTAAAARVTAANSTTAAASRLTALNSTAADGTGTVNSNGSPNGTG